MKTTNLCASAVALAMSMLALPSVQAASASATLTSVHIQLIDLTPFDGFTPTMSFDWGSIQGNASSTNAVTYADFYDALGMSGSASAGSGSVMAGSVVTGGDYFDLLNPVPGATASAVASGLNTQSYAVGWVLAGNFTVSANTLVYLTATAQASASAALGETASTSAVLTISNASSSSDGRAFDVVSVDGTHDRKNGPLSVAASFVNLTGSTASGFIGAYAEAQAHGVTAVPEPATYGLMGSGLLALGMLARRRRPR
jgi:hypothetical protein